MSDTKPQSAKAREIVNKLKDCHDTEGGVAWGPIHSIIAAALEECAATPEAHRCMVRLNEENANLSKQLAEKSAECERLKRSLIDSFDTRADEMWEETRTELLHLRTDNAELRQRVEKAEKELESFRGGPISSERCTLDELIAELEKWKAVASGGTCVSFENICYGASSLWHQTHRENFHKVDRKPAELSRWVLDHEGSVQDAFPEQVLEILKCLLQRAEAAEKQRDEARLAIWSHTCVHHTDVERATAEVVCPVCVMQQRDQWKAEYRVVNDALCEAAKQRDEADKMLRDLIRSVEQPELAGCKTLVLWFPTDQDREGFINDVKKAKPGMEARKL